MQTFARLGQMPTYNAMIKAGATGKKGLTQGFPPNTGQGWYTLATGQVRNYATETFTGTANSFMMGGGDGFTLLTGTGNIVQTADSELVAYVRGLHDPFTYTTDGRIIKA